MRKVGGIVILAVGILSARLESEAQQPARPYRVGILHEGFQTARLVVKILRGARPQDLPLGRSSPGLTT